MLRRLGYDVVEAENGEEAVRVATEEAGRIDLLLTDLSMNDVSGLEVAESFRATNPGKPVVYTSGYSDDSLLRRLADEGGTFLPKPYDMRDLQSTLDRALAG